MPRIPGTTHAQTAFLRAFRTHPAGPPPDAWPSPAILRKWLRRPTFKKALDSLQATLQFRADFLLATTASNAAQTLSTHPDLAPHDLRNLLRLSHTRPRNTPAPIEPTQDSALSTQDSDAAPNDPAQDSALSTQDSNTSDFSQIPHWLTLTAGQGYLDKSTNRWTFYRQKAIDLLLPVALQAGFYPPCQHHPNFPAPNEPAPTPEPRMQCGALPLAVPIDSTQHSALTTQDSTSYYHRLLHHPDALLCYMREYSTRFPHDHRFHKILKYCDPILPARGPKFEPEPL